MSYLDFELQQKNGRRGYQVRPEYVKPEPPTEFQLRALCELSHLDPTQLAKACEVLGSFASFPANAAYLAVMKRSFVTFEAYQQEKKRLRDLEENPPAITPCPVRRTSQDPISMDEEKLTRQGAFKRPRSASPVDVRRK